MSQHSQSHPATVQIGRKALTQFRNILDRQGTGQTAAILRGAGFAAGEGTYQTLVDYTAKHFATDEPGNIDRRHFGELLDGFFSSSGWGACSIESLDEGVIAIDAPRWAESEPGDSPYPACHISTGMLADLFSRLGGVPLAVMEVECRSKGDPRCRFLVGGAETLNAVYELMSQGAGYSNAIASLSTSANPVKEDPS